MTDSPLSAAYAYGRFLRSWHDAMNEFARHVAAGFNHQPLPPTVTPDERREQASIATYEQRIAAERRKGLAFVRAEAARARRDLGLKP